MTLKKTQTCLFLLGIIITGFVNSQGITIPLKKDKENRLFVTVKYGTEKCEVDLRLLNSDCSNIIAESYDDTGLCGSQYVGENVNFHGELYLAPFKLGKSDASILYSVPFGESLYNGVYSLCFSNDSYHYSDNLLLQLFQSKTISEKVVYYYFHNSANSQDNGKEVVGTLSIGQPIQSLSNDKFIPLLSSPYSNSSVFTTTSAGYFSVFGKQYQTTSPVIEIYASNSNISIPETAFFDIAKVMTERGTKVTVVEIPYSYDLYVDSIELLEPLHFPLLQEDGVSIFDLVLAPSQYTQLQPNGSYLLTFIPVPYPSSIFIGNSILESYNLGFDLGKQRVLISEKSESQNNNFRGAQIKL